MSRKRFGTGEKAVIADGPGTVIEWRDGTQWHAAILAGGCITTGDGWQSVAAVTLTSAPRRIDLSPGHIRRPAYRPAGALTE